MNEERDSFDRPVPEPSGSEAEPPSAPRPAPLPIHHPGPRPEERAERIYLELRTILRDVLKRRIGSAALPRAKSIELLVRLDPFEDPRPGEAPAERRFAGALLSQIGHWIESEIDRASPFPAGRVRCYWCGSFECVHAAPPGPHTVFGGYSATGLPSWPDLAAVALEKRDPRIEDLYREVPVPLTIIQAGSDLVSAQLPVYGQRSGIYRILGQVAVGYLSLPAGPRGEWTTVALTIQAVEVERGRPRIYLNIIGRLPDGTDLHRLLEEEPDSRLADALRVARSRLSEIGPRGGPRRRRGESRERQALAILDALSRNLDRIFRQRTRRTKHAQDRHRDRERPAAAALRDALAARPEEIYRDVQESTWVVIGPRSRVHIFNDAGKHITSVVYPGETVRRRTAQGKWRAAPPESVRGFREAMGRMAAPDGA